MFGFGKKQEEVSFVGVLVGVEAIEVDEVANVHTRESPYCSFLGCWCHTDVAYHVAVTGSLGGEVDGGLYKSALVAFGRGE